MATSSASSGSSVEKYMKQAGELFQQAQPYLNKVGDIINIVEPYAEKAWEQGQIVWEKLQPYHPEEFIPVILGFILIFFGGTFMTLIACIEAYRIYGWEESRNAILIIYENYRKAVDANAKDNAEDKDKDGIEDVKQIDKTALATRKAKLLLKSTDPQQLDKAVTALLSGFFGVVATLRIKFAKAIALGVSIADSLENFAEKFMSPFLKQVLPEEYHKWLPMIRRYVLRSVGISIAWYLARIISAVHSAVRGSELIVKGLVGYVVRHGYVSKDIKEFDAIFNVVSFVIGAYGWFTQIRGGFSLRFPWNVLLLPARVAESFLMYFVGVSEN